MRWKPQVVPLVLLIIAMAAGCQSSSMTAGRTTPEVPPGLTAELIQPRAGTALGRARMKLDQIVAALPTTTYLQQTGQSSGPPPEVPLAAQQAYVRARHFWNRQKNFEAIRQLESALSIAPDEPAILRLLGRLYSASGNRIRGAMYLRKAVAADSSHVESLYLLAKHEIEQGHHSAAIVTLARALSLNPHDTDPALEPLLHFYLAHALEREGYDAAAIEQFVRFLALPARFNRTTHLVRELRLLYRQRGMVSQLVGDANHRLGETRVALDAYLIARRIGVLDAQSLMRRIVYTQLSLNRLRDAQQTVMAQIRQAGGEGDWLEIVRYLTEQGVNQQRLGEQLSEVYVQLDQPPRLAMVLAQLLNHDAGIQLLLSHVKARPTDRPVFAFLLRQILIDDATPADAAQAVRIAADIIEVLPIAADPYTSILLEAVDGPDILLDGIAQLPREQRRRPAVCFIHGVTLEQADQLEQAVQQFQKAMPDDFHFKAARLALAKLLIEMKQYERAQSMLEPIDQGDPAMLMLHVRILADTDQVGEALELVNAMLAKQNKGLPLLLTKAELQLRLGDNIGAHRTLMDAVHANPTEETAYQALFDLYSSPQRPPGLDHQQDLMRKLRRHLPFSRLYRLKHAQVLVQRGAYTEAEHLVRSLLVDNTTDYAALDLLLQTLLLDSRTEQATTLIDQRIGATPDDRELLVVAQRFFLMSKNLHRYYEVREQLLLLEEDTPQRTMLLAALYLYDVDEPQKAVDLIIPAWDKPDHEPAQLLHLLGEALIRLDRADQFEQHFHTASQQFPQKQAELSFEWAMFWERQGQRERAEQIMIEQLDRTPKHAALNNGLAYTWADRGHNLQRAKDMIQIALADEPDNAAYLDSMGWVCYKLGDFPAAVKWLKRAKDEQRGEHEVILDHLGDAFFRVGKRREAQQFWQRAHLRLAPERFPDDPELSRLDQNLRAKLEALSNDRQPPIAEAPGHRLEDREDPNEQATSVPQTIEP